MLFALWNIGTIAVLTMVLHSFSQAEVAVKLSHNKNFIEVEIGGRLFTRYHFKDEKGEALLRPYLYPVLAADGTEVTSDQVLTGGDHPHHRSLWVAHGDVNGADLWEGAKADDKSPRQASLSAPRIEGDMMTHHLVWEGKGRKPMLREDRTLRFFVFPDGARGLDLTSVFMAESGPVTFGDTKEAGLCAVRVAKEISDNPTITNAKGMKGEEECWGKPAAWCDISGSIGGKPYGIAVLDHPENPRHPSRWHVRTYGLLTANIFGLSAFERESSKGAGALTLEKGQSLTFCYRVVIHDGDAKAADLDGKFKDFAGEATLELIFDGKDLTEWEVPSPNPWWTVEDGVLVGRQDPEARGHVLETKKLYQDLILEAEVRFSGDVDSGIFLRKGRGWQCQIGISRSLKRDMTCSIYASGRGYIAKAKNVERLLKDGDWNRIRIKAQGPHFTIWLNGAQVLDHHDESFPEPGPVGLQIHGGIPDMKVEFRNIRVRELGELWEEGKP